MTCTFPLASSDNSMSQYSDMQQRGADRLAATYLVAKLQDRCKGASMHAAHWSDTPCALQDMQVARTLICHALAAISVAIEEVNPCDK